MGESDDDFWKSKHYKDLSAALDEVKLATGAKDVASASAALAGKALFNAGIIAGKLGVKAIQELPNAAVQIAERQLKERPDIPEDRRERLESFIQKHKK